MFFSFGMVLFLQLSVGQILELCTSHRDFGSLMKYGIIAHRAGRISNYHTLRLLLILYVEKKTCCKSLLRSLNCWGSVRLPFLNEPPQTAEEWHSQSVLMGKSWSIYSGQPIALVMPCFQTALFREIFFCHFLWLRKFPYPLPFFLRYSGCYFASGKYRSFLVVVLCFNFSPNENKFELQKS